MSNTKKRKEAQAEEFQLFSERVVFNITPLLLMSHAKMSYEEQIEDDRDRLEEAIDYISGYSVPVGSENKLKELIKKVKILLKKNSFEENEALQKQVVQTLEQKLNK